MGNSLTLLRDHQGKEAASTIVPLKTSEVKKIVDKKKEIVEGKKKPKTEKKKIGEKIVPLKTAEAKKISEKIVPLKTVEVKKIAEKKNEIAEPETEKKKIVGDGGRGKEGHGHYERKIIGNAFALLVDQQDKEAATIVALKIEEVKKIGEEKKKIAEINKKKAEATKKKKQKKSCVRDDQKSLDSIVVDRRYSDGQGNTGAGQATQEQKVVNHHGNNNQEKANVRTVVLTKEELREQLLVKENERKKEEVERKEQWLAREAKRREQWLAREAERVKHREQLLAREVERNKRLLAREKESEARKLAREEERKKEMMMMTLKEYEEQKAWEKQEEKASLSVAETPLREATLDSIYTKQNSKDQMVKTDSRTKKYRKVRKTINIEEFLKLPTEKGQDGEDGSKGEDSGENENGNSTGYSNKQECALPKEENTVKVKAEPAIDLSEATFPVLGKSQSL